jgi:hypothetical protein
MRKQGMVVGPHCDCPHALMARDTSSYSIRASSWHSTSMRSLDASIVYHNPSLLHDNETAHVALLGEDKVSRTRVGTLTKKKRGSSGFNQRGRKPSSRDTSPRLEPQMEVPEVPDLSPSPGKNPEMRKQKSKPRVAPPPPTGLPPTTRQTRTPSHAVAVTLAFMAGSTIKLRPGDLPPGQTVQTYDEKSNSERRRTASKQVQFLSSKTPSSIPKPPKAKQPLEVLLHQKLKLSSSYEDEEDLETAKQAPRTKTLGRLPSRIPPPPEFPEEQEDPSLPLSSERPSQQKIVLTESFRLSGDTTASSPTLSSMGAGSGLTGQDNSFLGPGSESFSTSPKSSDPSRGQSSRIEKIETFRLSGGTECEFFDGSMSRDRGSSVTQLGLVPGPAPPPPTTSNSRDSTDSLRHSDVVRSGLAPPAPPPPTPLINEVYGRDSTMSDRDSQGRASVVSAGLAPRVPPPPPFSAIPSAIVAENRVQSLKLKGGFDLTRMESLEEGTMEEESTEDAEIRLLSLNMKAAELEKMESLEEGTMEEERDEFEERLSSVRDVGTGVFGRIRALSAAMKGELAQEMKKNGMKKNEIQAVFKRKNHSRFSLLRYSTDTEIEEEDDFYGSSDDEDQGDEEYERESGSQEEEEEEKEEEEREEEEEEEEEDKFTTQESQKSAQSQDSRGRVTSRPSAKSRAEKEKELEDDEDGDEVADVFLTTFLYMQENLTCSVDGYLERTRTASTLSTSVHKPRALSCIEGGGEALEKLEKERLAAEQGRKEVEKGLDGFLGDGKSAAAAQQNQQLVEGGVRIRERDLTDAQFVDVYDMTREEFGKLNMIKRAFLRNANMNKRPFKT